MNATEEPYPSDPIKPSKAANLLGVHPAQVYRWMNQGRLRFWMLPGGHRRLSCAEVLGLPKAGKPKRPALQAEELSRLNGLRSRETEKTLREFGLACTVILAVAALALAVWM